MFLRGDYWHYDFIVGGVRYRGSTGFKSNEKTKAAETEARLKVEAREGHSIEMIWEQTKRRKLAGRELLLEYDKMWDAFVGTAFSHAKDRKLKEYARYLRSFCQWMTDNHPQIKNVSAVLPTHAQQWIAYIRGDDGSNATKNGMLAALKRIFKALGKSCGIVENPFDDIKKLPKDETPREAFTPEELALIGKNATGWMYSLCLTAISTGLREGDVCTLEKRSVNLNTGWISIRRTNKTGVEVDIPILPGLRAHLVRMFEEHPNDKYVFPELAKFYINHQSNISREVKAFFARIGIRGATTTVPGYKRIMSVKDVHSFRHTFIYLAACHGIPFPIVQGIVGHLNPEMTKHYMDHAGRDAKMQYLRQLPDYLTGGQKINAPRVLTRERVLRILDRITPENFERNRKRLKALLTSDRAGVA